MEDSIVTGNQSGRFGSGLYLGFLDSPATIDNTTISENTVTDGSGGGLYLRDTELTITDSTIDDNEANGGSYGGGIYARTNEDLSIIQSTVSNNSTESGGGLFFNFHGTGTNLLIENSTFSGNSATRYGGAIYYFDQSSAPGTILNSTIVNNSATSEAGGIKVQYTYSPLNTKNSIIANNTASYSPDVDGTITSQGYNLIESTSGATINGTTTGNIYSTDPGLGTLQDNGGPTWTHAPTSTSSAVIDAGTDTGAPATDQRGIIRPQDGDGIGGAVTDIGALEYNPNVSVEAVADSNSTR
jgi:hypothetical protein